MKFTRRQFVGTVVTSTGFFSSVSHASESSQQTDIVGQTGGQQTNTVSGLDSRLTPYLGQFWASAGSDVVSQLRFFAEQGFRRFSDAHFLARPASEQADILLQAHELGLELANIEMGTDFSRATWAGLAGPAYRQRVEHAQDLLTVASNAGVKSVVLQIGRESEIRQRLFTREQQEKFVSTQLRRLAQFCDEIDITLLIEPLQLVHGHAASGTRMFIETHSQAVRLCQLIDHPCCQLVYDVFQQYAQGRDVVKDVKRCLPLLGAIQLADGFRRQASARLEPGQGEIDFARLLETLDAGRFTGWLGMEHGTSLPGQEGERRVLNAYRELNTGKTIS